MKKYYSYSVKDELIKYRPEHNELPRFVLSAQTGAVHNPGGIFIFLY